MRGTNCADTGTETVASVDALPDEAKRLLDGADGLFGGTLWWRVTQQTALPPTAEPVFLLIRSAGRCAAVVPLRRDRASLSSLTTPYTCAYAPAFAPNLDTHTDTQTGHLAASTLFGQHIRAAGLVRLDAIPAEFPLLPALEAGVRRAGLVPLRFDHFGNWHEHVGGRDWATYLQARPGAVRETIRRRLRKAEQRADARFTILTDPAQMDQAADAFESVYARSWKQPEPFPAFNVALMRAMAAAGWLRLGIWSIDARPVAVQFWAVRNKQATVLKLAHDEAFKPDSPGTVLTALMIRHLLEREQVDWIDFGRGDDPYKQGWAATRRQRIGLLLANPRHPAGLAALLRHGAGRLSARWRKPPHAQPKPASPPTGQTTG